VEDHDLLTMTRQPAGGQGQGSAAPGGIPPHQVLEQVRSNPQLLNSLPQDMQRRVMQNDSSVMEELIRCFITAYPSPSNPHEVFSLRDLHRTAFMRCEPPAQPRPPLFDMKILHAHETHAHPFLKVS